MAGEAKTDAFFIGAATVMVGPQNKLWDLNPADHSIGLVKNFQVTAEPAYTELTQGVTNQIVYSVLTSNPVRCQMEVYEYTSKNLAYGLGLDGSTLAAITPLTLKTAVANGGTSVVANAAVDPGYVAGDWIMIQDGATDRVHIAQLASNGTFSTNQVTLTLTAATAMVTGVSFSATTTVVSKVNRVSVGQLAAQPFLAAKIVAQLPKDATPITLLIPKMRIVRGFSLQFQTENFGNLPFEFTPYPVVSTDPNYAVFKDRGVMDVFTLN